MPKVRSSSKSVYKFCGQHLHRGKPADLRVPAGSDRVTRLSHPSGSLIDTKALISDFFLLPFKHLPSFKFIHGEFPVFFLIISEKKFRKEEWEGSFLDTLNGKL